jgi:hypothetical protein
MVRGIPGQEDPAHSPPVRDADVVAVDHGPQDLNVVRRYALVVEDLPNLLVAQEFLLVLVCAGREFPPVVTQRGRAIDRGTGWVAMEPEPVVGVPNLAHLGVDDDPPLGVGAPRIADPQLTACRRRATVGGDHIGRTEPLESIGAQVGQCEFGLVALRQYAQAFVLEQDLDVREPGHALAQNVIDCGLIQKLLRRMPGPA